MMTMTLPYRTVLTILLAAVTLSACESASPTEEQATQAQAEHEEAHGSEQAAGGVTLQADVPPEFPKDVPIYPQMNVLSAGAIPAGGFIIQAKTDEELDRVAEFYNTEMVSNGWTAIPGAEQPEIQALKFQKDGRTTSINLIPRGIEANVLVLTFGQ